MEMMKTNDITSMNWKLTKKKLSEVKPYDKNPRQMTKKGMEDLHKSIDKFGLAEPIVINTDGIIVGGHARFLVLKERGAKEFDCYIPDRKLSDKEVQELNVRLNKNIAGEFDFDILANEFELTDLLEWGFEEKELDLSLWNDKTDEQLDDAPEPQKEAISKTGDLFLLDGKHRVLCGDSTKKEDVEKLMDGKKATLIVTSPPYYNQRTYSFFKTFEEYNHFIEQIILNVISVMNEESALVWNIGDQCASKETKDIPAYHSLMFESMGLKYRDKIIWKKSGAVFDIPRSMHIEKGKYFPALGHESILVYTKKHPSFEIIDKQKVREWQINVWEFRQVRTNKESDNEGHPAQFPIEFPLRSITCYTKRHQNVYEPFGGSGTTLIATDELNRINFTMEIDPIYIDVILKRYHNLYPDKTIECSNRKFDFGKLYA